MSAPFPPTRRQMRVLRWVYGYQLAHAGVSPTFREVAQGLGLASKRSVYEALTGLEERGLIRRLRNRPRAIDVLVAPIVPRSPDGAPLFVVPGSFLEIGARG